MIDPTEVIATVLVEDRRRNESTLTLIREESRQQMSEKRAVPEIPEDLQHMRRVIGGLIGTGHKLGAIAGVDSLIERIAALTAELEQWKKWGIVEIAVRNPSVAEYMEHWEERATKAEATLSTAATAEHPLHLTCPFDGEKWRFHTQLQADMLEAHLRLAHAHMIEKAGSE